MMEEPDLEKFDAANYAECLNKWFKNPRRATFAWVYYAAGYWTICALLPCMIEDDLNRYQFALWMLGMLCVSNVYYATKAGYAADSKKGKPLMAAAAALMAGDWIIHVYALLSLTGDTEIPDTAAFEVAIMFFHSVGVLWATLFFYNQAIKNGGNMAWLTLVLEWLDLVMMAIVIVVLHNEASDVDQNCFDIAVCWGYFVALALNLMLWVVPIMFGFSDTERSIHIHMIVMDSCTDLPLVLTILIDQAYNINGFVFVDVAFKIIMLVRSFAYHGFVGLCIHGKEQRDAAAA